MNEAPYSNMPEDSAPSRKYFRPASDDLTDFVLIAAITYKGSDCISRPIYKDIRSFAETINNIPRVASITRRLYSGLSRPSPHLSSIIHVAAIAPNNTSIFIKCVRAFTANKSFKITADCGPINHTETSARA